MTRPLSLLLGVLLVLGAACRSRSSSPPTTVDLGSPQPTPAPPVESVCERGTAHLLATLREPVQLTAWTTAGTPKLAAFTRALDELLTGYERLAPGKIRHRMIEAATDGERNQAKEDGMMETTFDEGSKGFMGISFKYGSEKEQIPILSPAQSQGIAYWITSKIREVRDRADHRSEKIGVLTGKDEIKISDANLIAAQGRGQGPSIKGIIEQAFPFYKFEVVDLQNGEAEIDKELVGLIITQPGKDFTEKELRRIDQFVMLGNKSLAVFAGAVNLKASDATMKAELDLHGLDKLLDGYGIEMKKDAVFDWERPSLVRVMTQSQPVTIAHPGIVHAQYDSHADEGAQLFDPSSPSFFHMEEVAFPFPSTLVPHEDRQQGATMKVIARTTARSTAISGHDVEMKPLRAMRPQGEYSRHAMAVTLEGKLRSAFVGKEDRAVPARTESREKSRVLVISSGEFLCNPYARAGNAPPLPPQGTTTDAMGGDEELMVLSQPYAQQYLTSTILAFKNTLDWMTSDEDLVACTALQTGK